MTTKRTTKILACMFLACLANTTARAAEPAIYLTIGPAFEAHHDDLIRASGPATIERLGVDYGTWALESVIETPLYRGQEHVRRSVGVDVLVKPWRFGSVEPFAVAGAGYYWGSDPFQCVAVDAGVGCRFYVGAHVFLQLDAREVLPYDGSGLCSRARFQVTSFSVGGFY